MRYIFIILFFLLPSTHAFCAPDLFNVAVGDAQINQQNFDTIINQTSKNAIFNWQNLDLLQHERLIFNQPNQNSLAINRVINNSFPSFIDGQIIANGSLVFINPNGIMFGNNSIINAHNVLATTNFMDDMDLNDGNQEIVFDDGLSNASINLLGSLRVSENGNIILSAKNINWAGYADGYKNNLSLLNVGGFTIDLSNGLDILNLTLTAGNIDVLSADTKTNHGNISIVSGGDINISNSVLNAGEGDVQIQAGNRLTIDQSIIQSSGGNILLQSFNQDIDMSDSIVASVGNNGDIVIQANQFFDSNNCIETAPNNCLNGINFDPDTIRLARERERLNAINVETRTLERALNNNFDALSIELSDTNISITDGELDEDE